MLRHDYHHIRYVYVSNDDTYIIACQEKYIVYDDKYVFLGGAMSDEKQWESKVKGLLKAELARKDIGYKELVEKLAALGIAETPENIANKISRGKFTAVFFLQCMEAIGCNAIRLD
jgi:hypothetical protein